MSYAYGFGNNPYSRYPAYSNRYYQSDYFGNQHHLYPTFHQGQTDHLPRNGPYGSGYYGGPYGHPFYGYRWNLGASNYPFNRTDAFPMQTSLRRSVNRLRTQHAVDSILNRY